MLICFFVGQYYPLRGWRIGGGRFAVADEIRHVSMNDKESHSTPRSEDGHADDDKEGSDAPRPLNLHIRGRTYVTPSLPPLRYQTSKTRDLSQ